MLCARPGCGKNESRINEYCSCYCEDIDEKEKEIEKLKGLLDAHRKVYGEMRKDFMEALVGLECEGQYVDELRYKYKEVLEMNLRTERERRQLLRRRELKPIKKPCPHTHFMEWAITTRDDQGAVIEVRHVLKCTHCRKPKDEFTPAPAPGPTRSRPTSGPRIQ